MSRPELSNRIRAQRERLNLSQQQLADLVGVSRQAIVGIEGGKQVPSTTLGLRLARELRCGVEDLFTLGSKPSGLRVRLPPGGTLEANSVARDSDRSKMRGSRSHRSRSTLFSRQSPQNNATASSTFRVSYTKGHYSCYQHIRVNHTSQMPSS